jgi:hypothetical protein
MKRNPIFSAFPVRPLEVVVALVFLSITGASQAQVPPGTGGTAGIPSAPGQGSSVIGQPPQRQGGPVIGQPTPGPVPGQGDSSSAVGSDPSRDRLNRTNREAADIDRDGRLSPEEAARIPPGTPLPR